MKKLAIIGIGTRRFQQMTLESLSVLKKSDAIATLEAQPDLAQEFCDAHGLPSPEDLNPLYQNGGLDMANYEAIARRLIELLEQNSTVAFLVSGHPRLGVFLTNYLINQAKSSGWFDVDVYEGISSFDAMMNVTGRDPLEKGTAIVDINRAILFDYTLSPEMDHYLYHVCSVLNPKTEFEDAQVGNRVDHLQSYLLKHFPGSAPIMLIDAATDSHSRARVIEGTISELKELKPFIRFSTTLFVPGLKPKKINREALRIVRGAQA